MCCEVLLFILIISTRFVTGSMHVSALNSYSIPSSCMLQGPTKSTATSSHGVARTFLDGCFPYPWPRDLYCVQFISHRKFRQCVYRRSQWNLFLIVLYKRSTPQWPNVSWNHLIILCISDWGIHIFHSVGCCGTVPMIVII